MGNIFYNVISLILGIMICAYSFMSFTKEKKILLLSLGILHSLLLIASGVVGFIIPEDYSYIIIICMFTFTISYILVLVFLDKSKDAKKEKVKEIKKEEE